MSFNAALVSIFPETLIKAFSSFQIEPLFLDSLGNLTVRKDRYLFGFILTQPQLLIGSCFQIHRFWILPLRRASYIFYGNIIINVIVRPRVICYMIDLLNNLLLYIFPTRKIELAGTLGKAFRIKTIILLLCRHHRRSSQRFFSSNFFVATVYRDILFAVFYALSTPRLGHVESLVLVNFESFGPQFGNLLLLIGNILGSLGIIQILFNLTLPLMLNTVVPPLSRIFSGRAAWDRNSRLGATGTTTRGSELLASLLEVLGLDYYCLIILSIFHLRVFSPVSLRHSSLVSWLVDCKLSGQVRHLACVSLSTGFLERLLRSLVFRSGRRLLLSQLILPPTVPSCFLRLSLVFLKLLNLSHILAFMSTINFLHLLAVKTWVRKLIWILIELLVSRLVCVVMLLNLLVSSYVRISRMVSPTAKDYFLLFGLAVFRALNCSLLLSRLASYFFLTHIRSTTSPARSITCSGDSSFSIDFNWSRRGKARATNWVFLVETANYRRQILSFHKVWLHVIRWLFLYFFDDWFGVRF